MNTAPQTGEPSSGPVPLMQVAMSLLHELPGLVRDRLELMGLEVKRAAGVLVTMVLMVVAAAIMAMTAWALLWALLVSLMVLAGVLPWGALSIALAVNVAVAAVLLWQARLRWAQLDLPATRRHLSFTPSPRAGGPDPQSRPPAPNNHTTAPHGTQPAHGG